MTPINKHTIAINIYTGRWTLLEDIRVTEVTDREIRDIDQNRKLGIAVAANRGRSVALSATVTTTEPTEPVDWNVL